MKLPENLSPITKKLDDIIRESNSENENNQDIVPVEIDSEDSEDEHIDNKIGIKALPNIFKFSDLMKNTIGKLMSTKLH